MEEEKVQARIHSLNGQIGEVTVVSKPNDSVVVVIYNNVKCTAFFNCIQGILYADDVFGIIE